LIKYQEWRYRPRGNKGDEMRVLKIIGLGVGGLIGLVLLAAVGLLGYRAWTQHQNAKAVAITSPNGINEKLYVKLGGIDQYVEIRGQDRNNPVLLVLHGGPGASLVPITYKLFLPLEKHFTVVNWDQRGAGRTFGRNGVAEAPTMRLDRMAQDGIELAEFLRGRLHKGKIGILAASDGSTFGLMIAKRRPDLLYAYVGTGQVISVQDSYKETYEVALDAARRDRNDKAVAEILAAGPPPWPSRASGDASSKWLSHYSPTSEKVFTAESHIIPLILTAPDFSFRDFTNMLDGIAFTEKNLLGEFENFDIRKQGLDYQTSMVFIQGDEDHRTPTHIVKSFLDSVSAPHKELIILPGGAHTAALALPDLFTKAMVEHVRPLGVATEAAPTTPSPGQASAAPSAS
jgi:pimeloyl-ACP methyl ester carboxylesterase